MKMINEDVYGKVSMPSSIFDSLNSDYFISGCTDNVKFMCANDVEKAYLKSIGVNMDGLICDYFKLERL